jgi:hypothetical protein
MDWDLWNMNQKKIFFSSVGLFRCFVSVMNNYTKRYPGFFDSFAIVLIAVIDNFRAIFWLCLLFLYLFSCFWKKNVCCGRSGGMIMKSNNEKWVDRKVERKINRWVRFHKVSIVNMRPCLLRSSWNSEITHTHTHTHTHICVCVFLFSFIVGERRYIY